MSNKYITSGLIDDRNTDHGRIRSKQFYLRGKYRGTGCEVYCLRLHLDFYGIMICTAAKKLI